RISPGARAFLPFTGVLNGAAKVPGLVSLPAGEAKWILPGRTVNGTPLLSPTEVWTTTLPVAAFAPMATATLLSDQSRYKATCPPPTVIVEPPCVGPNRLP